MLEEALRFSTTMMLQLLLVIAATFLAASSAFKTSARPWSRCSITRRQSPSQLRMNMVDRFFRVVKSNLNNVLSSLEDPEKVLEQAVNDMNGDLVKIRQSYAEVSATQKRMEKQKEQAQASADDWYKRAQLALAKNDEELAREALSRRNTQMEQVKVYILIWLLAQPTLTLSSLRATGEHPGEADGGAGRKYREALRQYGHSRDENHRS